MYRMRFVTVSTHADLLAPRRAHAIGLFCTLPTRRCGPYAVKGIALLNCVRASAASNADPSHFLWLNVFCDVCVWTFVVSLVVRLIGLTKLLQMKRFSVSSQLAPSCRKQWAFPRG